MGDWAKVCVCVCVCVRANEARGTKKQETTKRKRID